MKSFKTLMSAVLVAALFSCNNTTNHEAKADANTQDQTSVQPPTEDKIPDPSGSQVADSTASPAKTPEVKTTIDWDKKIIKNGTIKLETEDFNAGNIWVRKTVKKFGGYISEETQNLNDYSTESIISIRLPNDQFDGMMNELTSKPNTKVIERTINTQDVTTEYIDTKARLEAKKQMRLKYLDFLKQAKNMEEVLQVQNEINDLQSEIEAATGKIQYLSNQSSYSTIHLTIYQPKSNYYSEDNPGVGARFVRSFKSGGEWFVELFLVLARLWPLAIIITAIVVFLKRYQKRKYAAKK